VSPLRQLVPVVLRSCPDSQARCAWWCACWRWLAMNA